MSFPIADRKTPESYLKTKELINSLLSNMTDKRKVLLHCRGGIGRVSLIASGILISKGMKTDETLEKISQARTLKVPDTNEQIKWLKDFEQKIR